MHTVPVPPPLSLYVHLPAVRAQVSVLCFNSHEALLADCSALAASATVPRPTPQ